jgi:LPS export ABC transporter protein LptC
MRNHPVKRFGIPFGMFAAAMLILWLVVSQPRSDMLPATPRARDVPFGEMDDFTYTRTVNGEAEEEIMAQHANFYQLEQLVDLQGVQGWFFADGRTSTISSGLGKYNLQTHRGSFNGGVVCRSSDDNVLHTPQLEFDTSTRQLHTDQAVLLEGPMFTLRGVGADADIAIKKVQIHQNIEATLWQSNQPR